MHLLRTVCLSIANKKFLRNDLKDGCENEKPQFFNTVQKQATLRNTFHHRKHRVLRDLLSLCVLCDEKIHALLPKSERCRFFNLLVPILFFACFLTFTPLPGETLLEKTSDLAKGDEIVFDFHQSIAVVHVLSSSSENIQLRVATATKDVLTRENLPSWHVWLQKGAPDASSDETLFIHAKKTSILESEETKRAKWLITLLTLELTPIPDSERRRTGPPPMPGEIDLRPTFNPKIIVQGRKIESKSNAFSARWPADTSELSSRLLIMYFPTSSTAVMEFPYWIESPSSSYHVGVIDSHRHSLQP
jgi:hypothetical protein